MTPTTSHGSPAPLSINRAPVLTLWAAVVAERLGYDRDAAATLGRAVAGLYAASKARTLGLTKPGARKPAEDSRKRGAGAPVEIVLAGRTFEAVETEEGVRALAGGKPISPASVHRYLESKFGDRLDEVRAAMTALARSRTPRRLADEAFTLYEEFRPAVPKSVRGWGARGTLDLARIRSLAAAQPIGRGGTAP